jgi:hypothetical protein
VDGPMGAPAASTRRVTGAELAARVAAGFRAAAPAAGVADPVGGRV